MVKNRRIRLSLDRNCTRGGRRSPSVESDLHRNRALSALLAVAFVSIAARARAQAPPEIVLEALATGLAQPTAIAHAGDARLFLTLQRGQIVVFDNGRVLSTPFLDLRSLVSCCGERGFLGLAFHPRHSENGFFFVDYTNGAGDTVIARYRVSAGNPDTADAGSGVILLTIPQPFSNHNGGQLAFGPDGYLYIGMGDGGSANDPMCNGQRDETLLGKILRIDVDASSGAPPFYGIPPDNPFAAPGGARDEIWAKGLRNPWRFSFDRSTGDLFIGDVGQGSREEIDFQPAGSPGGRNYGWKVMEGTACGGGGNSGCPSGVPACNAPELTPPILEYSHSAGDCSVTGGYVYRGRLFPRLLGTYFYGDYCTGRIWGATEASGDWTTRLFSARASGLTTFGEDATGELYLATEGGLFARIADASPAVLSVVSVIPFSGSARGGATVRIAGSGFVPGASVAFGDTSAPVVTFVDAATLEVVTPSHAAGSVNVVVTDPDGRSVTLLGAYSFEPFPRVSIPPHTTRTIARQ
ncbi:MAG TPA: PQQ-dependent sugar dehydrogenase [Thermoanaerobaculia bacterium]